MNWGKILLTGVVGGIVVWLYSFVMHGIIMSSTYAKYTTLFIQGEGNPFWFLLVAACMSTALAMIFAKTRSSWAEGIKGGLTFGPSRDWLVFLRNFMHRLFLTDSLIISPGAGEASTCWDGPYLVLWHPLLLNRT